MLSGPKIWLFFIFKRKIKFILFKSFYFMDYGNIFWNYAMILNKINKIKIKINLVKQLKYLGVLIHSLNEFS